MIESEYLQGMIVRNSALKPRSPILVLLLLALAASMLNAQSAKNQAPRSTTSDWQTAAVDKPEFDVASIRQSLPDSQIKTNFGLDFFEDTGRLNGLFSANTYLKAYIEFAYRIPEFREQEELLEKQLPAWAQAAPFAIEARAAGNLSKEQVRGMMRSPLEDRLRLKIHTETRQLAVYALVLAEPGKPGPGLRPHPPGAPCAERLRPHLGPAASQRPPVYCGDDIWQEGNQVRARMLNATMAHVAEMFTEAGVIQGDTDDRLIVDGTGLTGRYDLDLVFRQQASAGVNAGPDSGGQTAIEAMKKQLGLKLVKQTRPVSVFVIEHIERPTAS